ncbi:MAG: hypothetical protein JHC79_13380 [Williamsia sp.]|nr:hypothetical protein [Williamsia sp.]
MAALVGHTLSANGFGAYGIAFVIYTLALTVSRAATSMPFMLLWKDSSRSRGFETGFFGVSVLLSSFCGLVIACVSIFINGELQAGLLGIAAAIVPLLIQDSFRYYQLKVVGIRVVLAADTIFLASNMALQALVVVIAPPQALLFIMFSWGLSALLSMLVKFRVFALIRVNRCVHFFTVPAKGPASNLTIEAFVTSGSQYTAILLASAFAGLALSGQIRGGQVILGPLVVISQGVLMSVLPRVIELGARDRVRVSRVSMLFGAFLFVCSIVYSGIAFLIPDSIGERVLGGAWSLSLQSLLPLAIAQAFGGLALGATLGFRGLGLTSPTMWLRIALFPIAPIACVGGYFWLGVTGCVWALAVSSAVTCFALWWRYLRVAGVQSSEAPVPSESLKDGRHRRPEVTSDLLP